MPHNEDEIPIPVIPGTILHKILPKKQWEPSNLDDLTGITIHAEVPARIHLSVLDMTRFSPGVPGGGGVGYAIQMFARSEVRIQEISISENESEISIDARRSTLVEHITKVFLKHLGLSGQLKVMGAGHDINHMGLGSTSALVSAVALSLNKALGKPYTYDEIRYLIGYNFMEEWENDLVIPGFETGVGPFVGIHGGFGILSDSLHPVSHFSLPEDHDVVIALIEEEMSDTLVESPNAGISETELLMNRARALDERDRARKAYEVIMQLIPAGVSGDLHRVGESVWRLQHMGSKIAEIEHHSQAKNIYDTLEIMKQQGSLITGMSSVGPAIAALVEDGEEISRILKDRGYRVLRTRPDSNGMKISIK